MDHTPVPSTSRKRPHNSENLPIPSTSILQPKFETELIIPIKRNRAFSPEVPVYQQRVKSEPLDVKSEPLDVKSEPLHNKEPSIKTEPLDEKPSIQVDSSAISPLSSEILQPDTIYSDLGYIVKDLHALLPNSTWRTQVCSFWFFPTETPATHTQLTLLHKLYSFRLLHGSTEGTSVILVPPAASAHFGTCLKGSVHFSEEPDVALDALRHYLPASDESGLLSGIPLPTVPVCKKTGFMLGGQAFPRASLPKVRTRSSGRDGQRGVYFVGVVDVEHSAVRVDVYLAGDFFEGGSLMTATEEQETRADLNGYQRLATVLNMGKETAIQDNPIMESLYVDNIYKQLRKSKETCKLLGDIADLQDLDRLFATVQSQHADLTILSHLDPQHPALKLTLHAYQKRAVLWMINKERAVLQNRLMPHPLYFPIETLGGRRMYMHVVTKRLSDHLPEVKRPRGGILADEMGLGKTLETIALVLNHPSAVNIPRNPDGVLPDAAVTAKTYPDCYCGNRRLLVDLISCVRCGITHHKTCVGFEHLPVGAAFLCSRCQNGYRIESKTTLVVAPASVVPQWEFEIEKSARNIQVFRYKGVTATDYISPWMLAKYDIVLASYEILAHEALGGEGVKIINNKMVKTATQRCPRRETLRNKLELRSPLLAIQFHRFILDEAQMVETQTAHYALMTMHIRAHIYWAVSGTPIERGPADLQALFSFIEYTPWMYWRWFEEYLLGPYQAGIRRPLEDALGECLWRMDKETVDREVPLPICTIEVHVLTFSGIEMQLYKDVYRDCVKAVGRTLRVKPALNPATWNKRLREFGGDFVKDIRMWMDRLKKLCLSPMRVQYYFKEMRIKKKLKQRSTDEIIEQTDGGDSLRYVINTLLAKNRREFRDTLHNCIAACIDIAGLYWLMEKYAEAEGQYRRGLQLFVDNIPHVKVGLTQRLHILVSLRQLVTENAGQVTHTLEDDLLEQQAQSVRDEFYAENLAARTELMYHVDEAWYVVEVVMEGNKQVQERSQMPHDKESLKKAIGHLFGAMEDIGKCPEDDLELVHKCKMASLIIAHSDMARGPKERSRAMDVTYHTLDELHGVLDDRWDLIITERMSVISQIDDLVSTIWTEDDSLLKEWTQCHLDRKTSHRRCRLCAIGKAMLAYEDLLFRTMVTTTRASSAEEAEGDEFIQRHTAWRRNLTNLDDEDRDSTWSVGDFEKVCKAVAAYVSQKKCPDPADPAQRTIKKYEKLYVRAKDDWDNFQITLDAMKQEYKAWRNVWLGLHDEAFAFDQLAHCTLRTRLASDEDQRLMDKMNSKEEKCYLERWRLLPSETSPNERLQGLLEAYPGVVQRLAVDETRFKYIRNMHDGYVNAETIQARECCVCYDPVKKKWALFPCGHLICRECLKSLEKENEHIGAVACPVCRKTAKFAEILQPHGIRPTGEDDPGTELVKLQLRGTPQKIEAVLRTIFEVKLKDPTAKMLIFSEYADVLDDYSRVLRRNDLGAVMVRSKEDIPASIEKLRSGDAEILLLPIALGGKGLTIIEASHVFFLEPLMNRAAELQAIGRIHRMGQTKPTFVHKFIVQGTIEERMHNLMSGIGQEDKFSEKELTLRQALHLLQSTGFQGPEEDAWNALDTPEPSDTEDADSEENGSENEENGSENGESEE